MKKPTKLDSLLSSNLSLVSSSIIIGDSIEYALAHMQGGQHLVVLAGAGDHRLLSFAGETSALGSKALLTSPMNTKNLSVLRDQLPYLRPVPLGLQTSAGMGDRLGVATPGHVRAIRHSHGSIKPIFAQQSIRENMRTGRTPLQVLEDASWGVFQEGWQEGFGADADHLKTKEDIDSCFPLGYSFFTVDPGEHVNNRAGQAGLAELRQMVGVLPGELAIQANQLFNAHLRIEGYAIDFNEVTLLRSMAKYGMAIWHVVKLYRHLVHIAAGKPFEFEVSVDETEQPTTLSEHVYIASELKRLGVKWVSLAPRYVGSFEKGVDYIGDPGAFAADIQGHAAVARHFGPYKLSLHSGSDKFSIYPAAMQATCGLVHLKTAGTSYLEALRTIANLDTALFKEIYAFARERFEADKQSYHISAQLSRAPEPESVSDWNGILDQFDVREILHVTFGSVLKESTVNGGTRFRDRIMKLLEDHAEVYARKIEQHFIRHLQPFAARFEV